MSRRIPTCNSSFNQNQQKRYISREFKKRGLSLQPAALSALLNVLRRENEQGTGKHGRSRDDSSAKDILQLLLNEIKERMINAHRGGGDHRDSGSGISNSYSNFGNQSIVTKEILQSVVADLSRDENDVLDEAMQLLNAWKMKRLDYNSMKKSWKLIDGTEEECNEGSAGQNGGKWSVFGCPSDKVNMLLQRYHLIQQRILRQDIFQNKMSINYSLSSSKNILQSEQHKLTPIEGLLGTSGTKTLLGIIVQVEQNQYYIEDPTGSIPIDLSQVTYPSTDGFITEYSIVLIEGEMSADGSGMLVVHTIGHPMYESRGDAIKSIGMEHSNIFDTIPNLNELVRLQNEELEHGYKGMFVLLSDVHLDDTNVMEKLEKLFQGFEGCDDDYDDQVPLPVFILMGDFASRYPSSSNGIGGGGTRGAGHSSSMPPSSSSTTLIMSLFDDLADIISKFPRIAKEGRFVLIPSMNDIGLGSILPRPPLPHYFLKGLQSKVKHVHLASNPCRLRYFSKEIVLSRIDVLSKLRRNSILPPRNISANYEGDNHNNLTMSFDTDEDDGIHEKKDDDGDAFTKKKLKQRSIDTHSNPNSMDGLIRHSIKTVLDQGHLCPIPLQAAPIYWQYDHALRLYPSPDILVLSESTIKRYSEKYEDDVEVMNPGPFHVNYEFLVIKPCEIAEDSDELFVNVEFSQVI